MSEKNSENDTRIGRRRFLGIAGATVGSVLAPTGKISAKKEKEPVVQKARPSNPLTTEDLKKARKNIQKNGPNLKNGEPRYIKPRLREEQEIVYYVGGMDDSGTVHERIGVVNTSDVPKEDQVGTMETRDITATADLHKQADREYLEVKRKMNTSSSAQVSSTSRPYWETTTEGRMWFSNRPYGKVSCGHTLKRLENDGNGPDESTYSMKHRYNINPGSNLWNNRYLAATGWAKQYWSPDLCFPNMICSPDSERFQTVLSAKPGTQKNGSSGYSVSIGAQGATFGWSHSEQGTSIYNKSNAENGRLKWKLNIDNGFWEGKGRSVYKMFPGTKTKVEISGSENLGRIADLDAKGKFIAAGWRFAGQGIAKGGYSIGTNNYY